MKDENDTKTIDLIEQGRAPEHSVFNLLLLLKSNKIAHAEISILSAFASDMHLNNRAYSKLTQAQLAHKLCVLQPNISRSLKKLRESNYIKEINGVTTFLF